MLAGSGPSSECSPPEWPRSQPNARARSTCMQLTQSAALCSSIDSTCAAFGRSARFAENGRSGTDSRPRWRPGTDERRQATLSPNGAAQESNLPSVGLRRVLVLKVCRVRCSWLQKRRVSGASVHLDPARCGETGTRFGTKSRRDLLALLCRSRAPAADANRRLQIHDQLRGGVRRRPTSVSRRVFGELLLADR